MKRRGPPSLLEAANRIADAVAKSYIGAFGPSVLPAELHSFAAEGAAEALRTWNGQGMFEAFAAQRIRWAVLRRVRREILRHMPEEQREEGCALLAAERTVDTFDRSPDEPPAPLPSPIDLAEHAARAFRLELAHVEEADAVEVADPNADVERVVERMKLRRAIGRLPPPENLVVERHTYLGETHAEIATALEMPRSTVHEAYQRGIKRLWETLGAQPSADEPAVQPPAVL